MTFRTWRLLALACVIMPLLSVAKDQPKRETIPPWRIQALLAALDDPSIEVQRAAIRWLYGKDASDRQLVDKVGSLLADSRWKEHRAYVLAALASLGENGAKFATPVADLLDDPDREVRSRAAEALGRMGEAGAKFAQQVAATMRKDPDPFVVSSAREALERMDKAGGESAAEVADLKQSVIRRSGSVESLPAIPTKSPDNGMTYYTEQLKDSRPYIRESAVEELGKKGEAAAEFAPQVADLLKDQDFNVRQSAVAALWEMGEAGQKFAPQVADLLKNPSSFCRGLGAYGLGRMGEAGQKFAAAVAGVLNDPDPDARSNAAEALGRMGNAGAKFAPQVADLLKDEDLNVRSHAAEALGRMGAAGTKVAPQVAAMLNHQSTDVRINAVEVLGRMGDAAAEFAPRVADLLKESDPNIQSSAAEALGRMGEAGAKFAPQVAGLLHIVRSDEAFPVRSGAGRDEEPKKDARINAIEALVRMGNAGAKFAPRIAELLRDSDSDVQGLASGVLENFPQALSPQVILGCVEAADTYPQQNFEYLLKGYLACGVSDENLILIRWLGNRDQHEERPRIDTKDRAARLTVLKVMREALPQSARFPKTQKEITEIIAYLVRNGSWNLSDLPTLTLLKNDLKDYPDQADAIQKAIDGIEFYHRLKTYGGVALGHAMFWLALIVAYPRSRMVQGFFFWNKWPRRMFGLWYVGFLITVVPWLRRRMFAPFKEVLVPANLQSDFDPTTYFTGSEVVAKKKGAATRLRLNDVLGEVKGQTVLEGRSGLGKTMLLLSLAGKAKNTVVYVRAVECHEGVVAAIQGKLQGQAQDEKYLKTLIYAGAVDVLIDGLNEATPDARARITKDVQESFKGNFILTTQPLDWEAPTTARAYILQPLRTDQIEAFLLQQWPALAVETKVTKEVYEQAVQEYVGRILNDAQGQDTDDARLVVLSNPMEATLAAELLSKGEVPDLFRLVEQRYDAMAKEFEDQNGRPFPLINFSERVYEWKDSGNPYISVDGFEVEFQSLVKHKLVIQRDERLKKEKGEEEVRRWFFRHDKITDFFLVPAFGGSHAERRIEKVNDERFGGVYVLLALGLPLKEAQELHNVLVDWAAQTNQNDLLNRYTRAMKRRCDIVLTYGEKSGNDTPRSPARGVAQGIPLG